MNRDAKIVAGAVVVVLFCMLPYGCGQMLGDGSWGGGEHRTIRATVQSKHVDVGSAGKTSSTSYMVTTDKGTFEIENGWIMSIWNADEMYGRLEVGKTYTLDVQGDQLTNFMFQQYPFVTGVRP